MVRAELQKHVTRIGVLSALERPLHPDPRYLDAPPPAKAAKQAGSRLSEIGMPNANARFEV